MSTRSAGASGRAVVGVVDHRTAGGLLMRLYYPTSKPADFYLARPLWLPSSHYVHGMVQYVSNVDAAPVWKRAAVAVVSAALFPLRLLVRMEQVAWAAPPLEPPVDLPVVIFSHGLAGFRNMYGGLCSQLAADCGAVVAAVEHTDGSACAASMRDGSWCTYVHTDGALAWRQKQLQQRTAEIREALTELHRLHAGERVVAGGTVPLVGRLRLSEVVAAGHSFGAVTAMVAAEEDTRFTKTLAYDPWLFPLGEDVAACQLTRTPLCVLNSTGWNPKHRRPTPGDNEEKMAALLAARRGGMVATHVAEVHGTSHMSHSDPPTVLQNLGVLEMLRKKRKEGDPDLSPRAALAAFASLGVAFVLGRDFARAVRELDIVDERQTLPPAVVTPLVAAQTTVSRSDM